MSNHIIFSVFQSSQPGSVNEHNHASVLAELERSNVPHLVVEGWWLGQSEKSILISTKHEHVADVYCRIYKQDAYLKVDANNNAQLVSSIPNKLLDKQVNDIGVWQETSSSVAQTYPSYTKSGERYYVCTNKLLPNKTLGSRL